MKRRRPLQLLPALTLALAALQASEPTAFWLSLDAPTFEPSPSFSTKTNLELRFPEFEELSYYRLSQKLYFPLNQRWTLGAHPAFENSKSGDEWRHTYRLEMELNPAKIQLGSKGPTLDFRNRWELRWKEGQGSRVFHRLRQRTRLHWALPNGPFSSYGIGNELFYEEDKGKITANRLYPAILRAKHGPDLSASYYLLYESKRSGSSSNWNGAYILGASFSF